VTVVTPPSSPVPRCYRPPARGSSDRARALSGALRLSRGHLCSSSQTRRLRSRARSSGERGRREHLLQGGHGPSHEGGRAFRRQLVRRQEVAESSRRRSATDHRGDWRTAPRAGSESRTRAMHHPRREAWSAFMVGVRARGRTITALVRSLDVPAEFAAMRQPGRTSTRERAGATTPVRSPRDPLRPGPVVRTFGRVLRVH
jgi:hypothetical protein